jgi:hypothetical protein
MQLNIEETLEIFDDIEDEELKKAIEECDKSIANILGSMKNSNPIKKKKVSRKSKGSLKPLKSNKRDEWIEYVREVKRDIDSKSDSPISFTKALSEASRRRNLEKNISNINDLRRERVNKNRRSVRFSEKIEEVEPEIDLTEEPDVIEDKPVIVTSEIKSKPQTLPVHPNIIPTYTYRFIDGQKFVGMQRYVYESYKRCLCGSILEYTQSYTNYLNFHWVSSKIFSENTYDAKFTDNVRLFTNCWFYKYFDMVYDEIYKEKIVNLNFDLLDSFPISDLEYIVTFLNVVSKTQKIHFPILEIVDMGCVIEKK